MRINKSSLDKLKRSVKNGDIIYSEIADTMGEKSRQVVSAWVSRGTIPDEKVQQFSTLVGFEIKGKLSGRNAHVRLCTRCQHEIDKEVK